MTAKQPKPAPKKGGKKKTAPRAKPTKASKPQETKRPRGRPTGYTPALGRAICKMLASGMSLNEVCKRPRIKARTSESRVRSWALNPEHEFSSKYMRARELGYLRMADDILDVAADGRNDYMIRRNKDGEVEYVPDQEALGRSRLRVDTMKWMLSKALPKIYGDKVFSEVSGPGGGPIETRDTTPRATSEDHLANLARRYGGKGLTVIEGGKKSTAG